MSPSIFKCVLASCLHLLPVSVFYVDVGLSRIAYANEILLLSPSHRSLMVNFSHLMSSLVSVGLFINLQNCEFICFDGQYTVAQLVIQNNSLPCSSQINWFGITPGGSLSSTCSHLVKTTIKNIRVAYS